MRHELVRGFPRAREKGCRVHAAPDTAYCPHLMGVCGSPGENPFWEERPCLVLEVLSPSTEAQDRWEKMRAHLNLESLQAYLLLDPERKSLEGYFHGGKGFSLKRYAGGQVPLPAWTCPRT
ncbi:Uma2 family endonuclease [Thermus tenuipuniceus]|uniref:Uma2 family endonuclease n=1 Tax=Thermus tenuipuniceus TaxID=2078690 RepID=UPI001FC9FF03|nr:Uma2 family endonuclease [Thermus tenuipuniceus]